MVRFAGGVDLAVRSPWPDYHAVRDRTSLLIGGGLTVEHVHAEDGLVREGLSVGQRHRSRESEGGGRAHCDR